MLYIVKLNKTAYVLFLQFAFCGNIPRHIPASLSKQFVQSMANGSVTRKFALSIFPLGRTPELISSRSTDQICGS